jgi:hypothetical protein
MRGAGRWAVDDRGVTDRQGVPVAGVSRRAVLGVVAGALGGAVGAAPGGAAPGDVDPGGLDGAGAGRGALPTTSLLLAADQESERVLALDPDDWSWLAPPGPDRRSARQAALWSWSAVEDDSVRDLEPERTWSLVSEAKFRLRGGRGWVLTTASRGLAAVVPYSGGPAYWATAMEGNPHTMELLPDGNAAIAASEGGFVRLYAASQGPRSARCAQYDLFGAHGLQWDGARGLLWALGWYELIALDVGRDPARPQLAPVHTVALPDIDGHDLSAVALDPDRMWLTTADHVYQYSFRADAFARYAGQRSIDGPGIKSIGDDPITGQVLTVSPQADDPCVWCTATVGFHTPAGSRHLSGTGLYKARWMPGPGYDWLAPDQG